MRHRLVAVIGVWLLVGVALAAADFWEEQEFTAWSDKNVEKMLTDSPWAQRVRIVVGSLTEDALPTLGQPTLPTFPPLDDCVGQFGGVQRHRIRIAWTSALPIKQALVRQSVGLGAPVPPKSQQMLDQAEPFYTVTLFDIPPSFAVLASMGEALLAETRLKRKDGEPIVPAEVRLFQSTDDQLIRVVFMFPKDDAITLDDEEVELVTRLVQSEVKKKFKLKDMMFLGQLEL